MRGVETERRWFPHLRGVARVLAALYRRTRDPERITTFLLAFDEYSEYSGEPAFLVHVQRAFGRIGFDVP